MCSHRRAYFMNKFVTEGLGRRPDLADALVY